MTHVYGATIDDETRCVHYHTPLDIIAIKFKCCNKYYPCFKCHNESEKHHPKRWHSDEFDVHAILCGVCQHEMSIETYMMNESCPKCNAHFNNRCKFHYHHYFEI
ncbi:CHY zinc finger protein [Staphylococcus lutrae]|uniref:CHY-type domain-containing protein n=1 Tax=Staphylococcus lutrae TaxID=155085 RepID=A0AAC9RUQ5_9STAP|nr:CHY zinc finger protein [Staphylococcus lutrae]ARJ51265.1 hypothetical protein B5P37_08055 [Staphylococcus lutrae]PNZ39511.1 hypothetical protein CD134_01385 [Staphylococcus lutrae]